MARKRQKLKLVKLRADRRLAHSFRCVGKTRFAAFLDFF